MMDVKSKAIRGIIWSGIQNWGSQAIALLLFFVMARMLKPSDFGLVASANIVVAFLEIFLRQGFQQAIIQHPNLEEEHLDTAFWAYVGIGLLLTVSMFSTADVVAQFFRQPELTSILKVLSLLFAIVPLATLQEALLNRQLNFKAIAARAIGGITISGIVGIVLVFHGFGVWSLVFQQLIFEIFSVIALWSASDWRPKLRFSWRHLQELFKFAINIFVLSFLYFFNRKSDDFLIGYFLGKISLGYYTIAYRVFEVMTQLLGNSVRQVAMPTFARLQEDPNQLRQAYYKINRLTSLVAFPAFFGVVILAPEIVVTLFGERWIPSIPVMQVLAGVGIVRTLTVLGRSVLTAIGKPQWSWSLYLLETLLSVIGFLIAVKWGIVAVALALASGSYLVFPLTIWTIDRVAKIPYQPYIKQLISPLIGSIVTIAIIAAFKQISSNSLSPPAILFMGTILGAIVYSSFLKIFSPTLFQEVSMFARLAFSSSKPQDSS
jgi:O-antigen/teichoic acid export membrane protein